MTGIHAFRIGQVIALGFGSVLLVASLIALLGRLAYDVSTSQRNTIQTRSEVERLTLELELFSIRRTDYLAKYLASGDANLLNSYQTYQSSYEDVSRRLAELIHTPNEIEALRGVTLAEAGLENKAQEVLRLYDSGFSSSARFLWASEGILAQDKLLQTTAMLRTVQGNTSKGIIEQARQIEERTVLAISVFVPIVLFGALVIGYLITRNITRPISRLVDTVKALSSNLDERVIPSGPREIAFLGETVNAMATNLSTSKQALQAHKERLESELTLASQIQTSFMPSLIPQRPGLELATFRQSARELGGDFVAFIDINSSKQGVAVGDASGKGAPAAMASALAVGLLEAYAPIHPAPQTLLAELNQDLHTRFSARQMNIACCYAIVDEITRCLTIANAGCIYPYLRRGQSLTEIDVYGLPLGVWPEVSYVSQSRHLCSGDLILLSSDGLVEAKNENGELFGFDRLEAELLDLPLDVDAQLGVDHLVNAVMRFTGNIELHDDLTLVLIRVV